MHGAKKQKQKRFVTLDLKVLNLSNFLNIYDPVMLLTSNLFTRYE